MRETLCYLCQTIIKLILLKLLTLPPDDLLNIDNPYFEQMVGQIYPTELQLNKANSSDTEAPFMDLNLSITNGIVSSKIYDKRDDFNFEIVNFPFLDGDVPHSPSYGVYISQLIRFARVCSNVDDFNNRNLFLTAKLLKQGYRYHKIRKAFSKFYYRHSELIQTPSDFSFANSCRQIHIFCAKFIISSHLATMGIGSANPEHSFRFFYGYASECLVNFFLKIGIFFSKLRKKSPKFHWEEFQPLKTPKSP